MDYDAAIIGSGFGGSVCACRAAQAGLRVVVLERGRRMGDQAYWDIAENRAKLFHGRDDPGLVEVHRMKGLGAVSASAVGGGSHVYTGVTVRAPREVFDHHWPRDIGWDSLAPYYDRVEAMIAPRPIPSPPSRARAVCDLAERLGGVGTLLPLAMEFLADGHGNGRAPYPPTLRGFATTVLRGGPSARKRTLDGSYLAVAESAGAKVRALHEVTAITPTDGGYRIKYRVYDDDEWLDNELTARRVVIAAGTFGTLRLLLTCRDRLKTLPGISQALGERFFTNGDFGAVLVGPRRGLEPDDGPPVTAWLDWWKQDRLYLMETNLFLKSFVWSFGVMGFDDAPGRIVSDKRGRLQHWRHADSGAAFHSARLSRLRELAKARRARLLAPPGIATRHMPVTVHPLGGAALAESPVNGVTNPFGEVFGYPGLYVADGALLPTPSGVPPSMTIAALAERVAENLILHA